jgi:hypothetical protein
LKAAPHPADLTDVEGIGTLDAAPSEFLARVHLYVIAGATSYEVVTPLAELA